MDVLGQLPMQLLHIMRDIRMEQLEEQRRQVESQTNQNNSPHNGAVIPQNIVGGSGLEDMLEELQ